MHLHLKRTLTLLTALSLTTGLALDRVPGTQAYYSYNTDLITDVNKSFVVLYEANDTTSQTFFTVRCANDGQPEVWASLNSKNVLMKAEDAALDLLPAVTMRLGNDAPIVLAQSELSSVIQTNTQQVNVNAVALNSTAIRQITAGLNAGKRLVVRVNRSGGGQALTYTFPAAGFSTAWAQVRECRTGVTGGSSVQPASTAPSGSSVGSAAPKFTRWYFTTCRDAASGAVRTGLPAGRAHLCDLVIETVPNGAQPVSAEFRYELEYREGGSTGKLKLATVDVWPPAGGLVTKFRQSGNQLVFTLPLNVRARPERVYTSINVTATVRFSNGTSKSVYEPLPVTPSF